VAPHQNSCMCASSAAKGAPRTLVANSNPYCALRERGAVNCARLRSVAAPGREENRNLIGGLSQSKRAPIEPAPSENRRRSRERYSVFEHRRDPRSPRVSTRISSCVGDPTDEATGRRDRVLARGLPTGSRSRRAPPSPWVHSCAASARDRGPGEFYPASTFEARSQSRCGIVPSPAPSIP